MPHHWPQTGVSAERRAVTEAESRRANGPDWDRYADEYQATHGAFLGDAGFVWGPEGLTEDEAGVLGDVAGRDVLEVGSVRMDVERHTVEVDGREIAMPLKEFELLELLLRNAGRVLTRGQLIDRVWGSDYFGDTKTLDVHIKRIRSKIEREPSDPVLLVTVRGLGYRFEA